MYDLIIYSLKVGACLAVFYLFFKLLLSRETFHRVNRFVVLAAMVLSFVLPVCVITIYREMPAVPVVPGNQPHVAEVYELPVEPLPEPFPWETLFSVVFLAGAGATLLWTLCSVAGVARLIYGGRREKLDDGSVLVRTEQPVTPFSWCRYIVLAEKDLVENGDAIILHEKAHLQLRHSVDLLITDLVGCLQWFNPAMWLLRRELRAIHEYEADRAVLDSGVDAKQYQLLLIRKAAGGRWYSIANSFNHSKLKNRITMMLSKRSSRWAGAKVLFVLPLMGLALGAFARTAYIFPEDKQKYTIHIESRGDALPEDKNDVLILVDGVEAKNIDHLTKEQIGSITVLKDTATRETYGEKGKNGVVLITTKGEGSDEPTVVSYGGDKGTAKVTVRSGGTVIKGPSSSYTINIDNNKVQSDKKIVLRIDGKDYDMSELNNLDKNNIGWMSVFKNGEAVKQYGEDIDGIIEITTKQKVVNSGIDAANVGIEAARAGIEAARAAIEAAGAHIPEAELQQARAELEKAREELDKAREEAKTSGKIVSVTSSSRTPSANRSVVSVKTTSSRSGSQSSDSNIVIRGLGTNGAFITANDDESNSFLVVRGDSGNFKKGEGPLYVIDGKVQKNMKKMESLSSAQIESISVLKDASAVKKYGKKAKNGVVVVTTK